jgi:hypothetical protein
MNLNNQKYFLTLLIGLLLVLLLTSSFFHNHPITLEEPSTCPVYLFQITLASAIISILAFTLSLLDKSQFIIFFQSSYIPHKVYIGKLSNRAPPADLD